MNETDQVGPWQIVHVSRSQQIVEAAHFFDDPVTVERAEEFLAQPGHMMLVALTSTGTPIGFVTATEIRHPDKHHELFINELGVETAWRRRGVARALLEALASAATSRNIHALWTATEPDNVAALATYRAVGAEATETAVMIDLPLDGSLADVST